MKKPNLAVYMALAVVVIGLIFQFMEMGVFSENQIPAITKYNQLFFWSGVSI
ncbi:hypothetical protein LCGC14_0081460 [marine sediment metagenome]|uniref:Uncharacterized protein n=1 Tax=marine sediment metagenome TaxID=412755 RepID=A0A0F9YJW2_9ZZZZ|nr:hypothetical protein [Maribacter sp.]